MTGDDLLDFVNNTLFPTLKGIQVSKTTPINKAIVKTTFEDTNNYMKDGVLLRQVVNVIDELDLTNYEESHAFGDIYESILKELQSAGSAGEFYTPRAVTDFMAQMIKPVIGEKMADFACGTGGFIISWLKSLESQKKTVEDRAAFDTSITTNILFFDRTGSTKETWFYRLDMPDGYKNFSKTKPMKLEHFAPAIEWWSDRQEITIDGFDKAKKYTVEELAERSYNIDLCGFPHEEEEILPPRELIQQYQEKRASLNADIDRILEQISCILGIEA